MTVSGGNLTLLVVRGAGHMVPISKPRVAKQMAEDFILSEGQFTGEVERPSVGIKKLEC